MLRTARWPLACALLLPCLFLGSPHLEAQTSTDGVRGETLFPVHSLPTGPDGASAEPGGAPADAPVFGEVAAPGPFVPAALQDRRTRGTHFMIGGAVAVVVGAVVGGDGGTLLVLGGLAAAGYGFYLYVEP